MEVNPTAAISQILRSITMATLGAGIKQWGCQPIQADHYANRCVILFVVRRATDIQFCLSRVQWRRDLAMRPPERRQQSILILFALLFGGGILVYSGADGRPQQGVRPKDARMGMVDDQIAARGVRDERVLAAFRRVPRHAFVPESQRDDAYTDRPLPIGHGQTISQPYIVAAMTELLRLSPGDRVLEVGTGSGYQAAVLAELGAQVFSIEIVAALATQAQRTLSDLGFDRVAVKVGDGFEGWPEHAPYDAIVVTAAPKAVPPPLLEQLKPGGRMVIPVGGREQVLRVFERSEGGELNMRPIFGVRFVPMTGRADVVDGEPDPEP